MSDATPEVVKSDGWFVTTFYQAIGKRPIQHVYGPFPRAYANRERRLMLDRHEQSGTPGIHHVTVTRAIKLETDP